MGLLSLQIYGQRKDPFLVFLIFDWLRDMEDIFGHFLHLPLRHVDVKSLTKLPIPVQQGAILHLRQNGLIIQEKSSITVLVVALPPFWELVVEEGTPG